MVIENVSARGTAHLRFASTSPFSCYFILRIFFKLVLGCLILSISFFGSTTLPRTRYGQPSSAHSKGWTKRLDLDRTESGKCTTCSFFITRSIRLLIVSVTDGASPLFRVLKQPKLIYERIPHSMRAPKLEFQLRLKHFLHVCTKLTNLLMEGLRFCRICTA